MKYIKKELNGYNLHMIKLDTFKTINVELSFILPISKENITKAIFLNNIVNYSSKKYKTMRELEIEKEELYSASIESFNYKMGNQFVTGLSLSILEDKYTEKGNFVKGLDLIKEIVLNPNISNSSFDKDSFNVIKSNMRIDILGAEEESAKLSLVRMLDSMTDNNSSLHEYGYLEELDKITVNNLYDFYNYFLNNTKLDVFVVGDIDLDIVEKWFSNNFNWNNNKYNLKNTFIIQEKSRKEKTIVEKYPTNQGKLSIGFTMNDLTEYESLYVLPLYSIILGGDSNSRLFTNIREKNSLCYYINSNYDRKANYFYITSGINKDNLDVVISLIKDEIKDIELGNITDKEIKRAKTSYKESLERIDDSSTQIIALYYQKELFNVGLVEERIKNIDKVTKEDLKNISNKINMNTIYLLGGDTNE
ncbi:MAG: insulinase family protein [Bacilli bacterium]|nr:insulinase family protein [Bacilli bacterium]